MKKVLILLLLILVATYAVDKNLTKATKVIMDDKSITPNISNSSILYSRSSQPTPLSPMPLIGRQEVIGYTTFDVWYNGPVYTNCRVDPVANGIHCHWLYSNFAPGTDRNEYYNFYDFSSNAWSFPAGNVVFSLRSGFGGMDYDPITGCAVVSTHQTISGVITPVVGRDAAPGAGLFDVSPAANTYQWPPVAVTHDQAIHIIHMLAADYTLRYTRCSPWNTWSTPILIPDTPPGFPDHNIAASKTSNKVIVTWVSQADVQERGWYKLSTTGGTTWGAQTQIPFPPSTIPTPSFYITSLFAMFDNSDNLHIVADVSNGTQIMPAEIWHYCPTNTPAWRMVHRYTVDTLNLIAGIGSNALLACRPSIVQAPGTTGNFYVAWEQFDTLNVEVTTSQLRGDIWVAELTNNGQTVTRKGRITDPNTTSKRTPIIGGVKNDTVFVMYLMDSIAGFYSAGTPVGRGTVNPVILQRFHKNSLPIAIAEENPGTIYNLTLNSAYPNPSLHTTNISYIVPVTGNVNLTIYDILGRPVRTLVSGTKTPGEYTAIWDGKDATGKKAEAGIFFYTLKTADKSVSRKLIRSN